MLGNFTVKPSWTDPGMGYYVKPRDPYGLSYYQAPGSAYGISGFWQDVNLRDSIWLLGSIAVGTIIVGMFAKKVNGGRTRPRSNPRGKGYGTQARYYHLRVASPGGFTKGSFRTIDPGKRGGAKVVIGRKKGKKTTGTQSVLVPKSAVPKQFRSYMKGLEKRLEKKPAGTSYRLQKRLGKKSPSLEKLISRKAGN